MDHVYDAIRSYYDVYFEMFMKHQRTGNYKKLADNPMYGETKAIIDAMNCIRRHLGWKSIKLSEDVKAYE